MVRKAICPQNVTAVKVMGGWRASFKASSIIYARTYKKAFPTLSMHVHTHTHTHTHTQTHRWFYRDLVPLRCFLFLSQGNIHKWKWYAPSNSFFFQMYISKTIYIVYCLRSFKCLMKLCFEEDLHFSCLWECCNTVLLWSLRNWHWGD